MQNDKEIEDKAQKLPVEEVARKLGLSADVLEKYGAYKAKVLMNRLPSVRARRGKLVMVTAMTPTPAGEGKTTTAIGLADALNIIGRHAVVALREPSLGPVFGMKGGATGGGYAQVTPRADINLHFTGDFHAITSAHNLLAAMVDNRVHFDGSCGLLDCRHVAWKRVMDMNDRVLRQVVVGLGDSFSGIARETGFDITAASEVMAVFCLSKDLADLKARLSNIFVGYSTDKKPVFARDVKAAGAMTALLKDALHPNLVQSLEGTPALIHGGPFANIAHGTNSVIATGLGLELADIVVTETGFGADLGAEKFFDIVVRTGSVPPPAACVLVATLRALKLHGGVKFADVGQENPGAVERGFANLEKHVENMRIFGIPFVIALNLFPTDTDAEINKFAELCGRTGARFARSDVFGQGGRGGVELAREVMEAIDKDEHQFRFLYPLDVPLVQKVETITKKIYGAKSVEMEAKTKRKFERLEAEGFGGLPVCIAKTQYSFSDNSKALGRPEGYAFIVTDVSLSSGAGFIVVLCGDMMTMPGLSKSPAAERIDISEDGEIIGLS